MSTDIITIVSAIPDGQPASVTLTDSASTRRQLNCVFKESEAPSFYLLFSPGTIPEDIQKDWRCILVSKDTEGEPITFSANIVEVSNNRVIELVARKSIRPEDLREYFRVNLKMPIEIFHEPEESDVDEESLELTGETVDISQTGVLSILSDECKITKPLYIEIDLPNPAETIICSGHLIRSKRIRKKRWLTSFHFDNLSSKSREIIAKNCFSAQRQQLREKIQTS
ncbi:MAG: PilZ domain-containing protein [Desulfobulbaceae bacterium]|nr:PilZ domain-containing protein [Desulfobulbaceae bacterium]